MTMTRSAVLLSVFFFAARVLGVHAAAPVPAVPAQLAELGVSGRLFGEDGFTPGRGLSRGDAVRLLAVAYNLDSNYPEVPDAPYADIKDEIRFYRSVCLAYAKGVIPGGGADRFEPNRPTGGVDFAVMLLRARSPEKADAVTAQSVPGMVAELTGSGRSAIESRLAKTPFTQADALALLYDVHMPEVRFMEEKMAASVAVDAAGENRIAVGQAVRIVLRENQTTPYVWFYRVSGDKSIRLLTDRYVSDPNSKGAVGVGGKHYFYFIAEAPGECAVELWENRRGAQFDPAESILIYKLNVGE